MINTGGAVIRYRWWVLVSVALFGIGLALGFFTPGGVIDFIIEDIAELEEFSILLPQTTQDAAENVAQRTLNSVSNYTFSSFTEKITVSIGIATVPEKTIDTAEKLIHAADLALYKAKANGRDRVECFLLEES